MSVVSSGFEQSVCSLRDEWFFFIFILTSTEQGMDVNLNVCGATYSSGDELFSSNDQGSWFTFIFVAVAILDLYMKTQFSKGNVF